MRGRVSGMLVAAMALVGCGGPPPEPAVPVVVQETADLAGVWFREIDGAGGQRLTVFPSGIYELAGGGVAFTGRPSSLGWDGEIEYGRLRLANGLQFDVDSIVRFDWSPVTQRGERTVVRGPVIFIEGHPFSNARATILDRTLVLDVTNASVGAPASFRVTFRRL